MYKEGDHYADWKNLTPFPDNKRATELGLKVGDLVVLVNNGNHVDLSKIPLGTIIEFIRDDGSYSPRFKTLNGELCGYLTRFCPLPTQTQKPESASIFLPHFMSDLITKLKTALKGEPSRTMIAAGVEAMDGSLTADGIKLVDDRIRSEWYKANKEALAKEIKALEEEKKK